MNYDDELFYFAVFSLRNHVEKLADQRRVYFIIFFYDYSKKRFHCGLETSDDLYIIIIIIFFIWRTLLSVMLLH